MKTSFFIITFLIFSSGTIAFATNIDLRKDPPPPPIPTAPVMEFPLSATIDDSQLEVYFDSPVGDATITVYDANNNIVSLETVDTDSISDVFISTDSWTIGTYTLKISYGTTRLTGEFQTE